MRSVKVQLIIEKDCQIPENWTNEDLIRQSKKISKLLDMGYHVEVKILDSTDQDNH